MPDFQRIDGGEPESLEVRLRFGEEADLDLHVTDPALETVYFGNNPSKNGGVLEHDRRCRDPAPRIESVTFRVPTPGRYRVGVDHVERCKRTRGPIPYEIEVRVQGSSIVKEGAIEAGRFNPVALEFELPPQ